MKKFVIYLTVLVLALSFVSCSARRKSDKKADNMEKRTSTTTVSTKSVKESTEEASEKKIKIAIDPGHQKKQMSEQEAIGPGAGETKPKVSSGTVGTVTGKPEYAVNLEVSLKLKKILESRGYKVYMIRETNDVSLSNKQRSLMANKSGSEILVRIHCNSDDNSSVHGALTICPTASNPYCGNIVADSKLLSKQVLKALCAKTGANERSIIETDNMTGINWSKIPVTIVEMGFMSNPEEDRKLSDSNYQKQIAEGIAEGIHTYIGGKE